MNKYDERMKRLVERILDHGCIPFVGAGVSGHASHRNPNLTMSSNKLTESLCDYVCRTCQSEHHRRGCPNRCILSNYDDNSLSKVAEIAVSVCGRGEVLEVMGIRNWPDFK